MAQHGLSANSTSLVWSSSRRSGRWPAAQRRLLADDPGLQRVPVLGVAQPVRPGAADPAGVGRQVRYVPDPEVAGDLVQRAAAVRGIAADRGPASDPGSSEYHAYRTRRRPAPGPASRRASSSSSGPRPSSAKPDASWYSRGSCHAVSWSAASSASWTAGSSPAARRNRAAGPAARRSARRSRSAPDSWPAAGAGPASVLSSRHWPELGRRPARSCWCSSSRGGSAVADGQRAGLLAQRPAIQEAQPGPVARRGGQPVRAGRVHGWPEVTAAVCATAAYSRSTGHRVRVAARRPQPRSPPPRGPPGAAARAAHAS